LRGLATTFTEHEQNGGGVPFNVDLAAQDSLRSWPPIDAESKALISVEL
jgi:hypothetical protein